MIKNEFFIKICYAEMVHLLSFWLFCCEKLTTLWAFNVWNSKMSKKILKNKHIGTVDIGMELAIDKKTVLNHLHKAVFKKNVNMLDRINVNNALLKCNDIELFLKHAIIVHKEHFAMISNIWMKMAWNVDIVFHILTMTNLAFLWWHAKY